MSVAGRPEVSAEGSLSWERHRQVVDGLRRQLASLPADEPVRLAKRTSNLFRTRDRGPAHRLAVGGLDGVIEVDSARRTAEVQGMATYEHLLDATLASGMMPLVVPELKTITLGGAVTGLGIESSSFRSGMPHESVLEMEILTGGGSVVTASASNDHSDLFRGFPNSYGTIGYLLRARIELEEVSPYVHLRHLAFDDFGALLAALAEACEHRELGGERVDFVDGTVFSAGECYLSLGSWAGSAPYLSDYTTTGIYYHSIPRRQEDWLTVRDYIWRWDTDWFWCSRAFGVQRPAVRRVLGALAGHRALRSDVYWRLMAFEERHRFKARLDAMRGLPPRESVVQDVEIPLERAAEFAADFLREVPITPFWICPLRQRDPAARWELYPLDPSTLYVNFGFWSSVALEEGMDASYHNRWVEGEVERLGGRKSLYSTSFYDRDRFWSLYSGRTYQQLKRRYDPEGRLLDLYDKCVGSR